MNPSTCDALALLREDLRGFAGYRSARSETVAGTVWLNANEAPHANVADGGCNRQRTTEGLGQDG